MSYRRILARADAFFAAVSESQPQDLQCGGGCSLCCHGLFSRLGRRPVIAEALARCVRSGATRSSGARGSSCEECQHPNLPIAPRPRNAAFFERTSSVPLPHLDERGKYLMYDDRPLVCRPFGLPIRDGADSVGDVCELNFTESTQEERERAAWDLQWEDALGAEDEFTIPEAIVLAARMRS